MLDRMKSLRIVLINLVRTLILGLKMFNIVSRNVSNNQKSKG